MHMLSTCLLAGQSVLAESEMGGQLGGRAGAGVLGAMIQH